MSQEQVGGRNAPAVSINMIFHNPGRFFDEAIRSVLDQTYTDWELLLVDDGSTDGSDVLARRFAADHPDRIRYLHHPGRANHGTGPSRNLGVSRARGRYYTVLDADDRWRPDFLARRVAVLESRPDIGLVYAPYLAWYSWSGPTGDEGPRDFVPRPLEAYPTTLEPPRLVRVILLRSREGGVPVGMMTRADVVRAVGAYPPAFRDMYEDQALLCKLGLRLRACVLDGADYFYRRHPRSMVTVYNSTRDRRAMRLHFLHWLEGYLDEESVADSRVRRLVRDEIWKSNHPRLASGRAWIRALPGRVQRRLGRSWISRRVSRMWSGTGPGR